MRERNGSSRIESSDTSRTSAPPREGEPSEPERLPRGSGLLLETIFMLAREIQAANELDQAQALAASIAEDVGELIERYNRQMKIAA